MTQWIRNETATNRRHEVGMRCTAPGQSYQEQLRKKIQECQTLLLLGEPDYIQLYLSHYPIVEKPFLLDVEDDEEEDEE